MFLRKFYKSVKFSVVPLNADVKLLINSHANLILLETCFGNNRADIRSMSSVKH